MRRFLLPVLLALTFAFPAFVPTFVGIAQDTTDEPPTPTAEVTVEPTPVETPAPEPPSLPIPPDAIVLTVGELLLYLALALLGGGGIMAIVSRFLDSREARDRAEKLYLAASPDQQKLARDVIDIFEKFSNRLLDFAKAATDGQPNEPPAPEIGLRG